MLLCSNPPTDTKTPSISEQHPRTDKLTHSNYSIFVLFPNTGGKECSVEWIWSCYDLVCWAWVYGLVCFEGCLWEMEVSGGSW